MQKIDPTAADCKSVAALCFPYTFPRNSGRTFPEQGGNAVAGGIV